MSEYFVSIRRKVVTRADVGRVGSRQEFTAIEKSSDKWAAHFYSLEDANELAAKYKGVVHARKDLNSF